MLYTLIVAVQFWVRELGGAGPETVAGVGTVAGAVAGAVNLGFWSRALLCQMIHLLCHTNYCAI